MVDCGQFHLGINTDNAGSFPWWSLYFTLLAALKNSVDKENAQPHTYRLHDASAGKLPWLMACKQNFYLHSPHHHFSSINTHVSATVWIVLSNLCLRITCINLWHVSLSRWNFNPSVRLLEHQIYAHFRSHPNWIYMLCVDIDEWICTRG